MVGGVESPAQGARLPFGPSTAPSRAVAEHWKKIVRRAARGGGSLPRTPSRVGDPE
jgi:hypothetical protein